jgi:hypothetical protein
MSAPVTHINLLQRTGPVRYMSWAVGGMLVAIVGGISLHGTQLWSVANAAASRRDALTQEIKQVQNRLATIKGEQATTARSLALRKEVDALQPRAQAAQVMVQLLGASEGGRSEDFARVLAAVSGVNEQGLWLTGLTLSAGGRKLELQGEAQNGAAVLRYARRTNESLKPLTLRTDTLELQPPSGNAGGGAAAGNAAAGGAISFRLF